MIVLGLDPGLARLGYGIINKIGNKYELITYGVITTNSKDPIEQRLIEIETKLTELIQVYQPQTIGIEKLFFNTNTKTAFIVAQAKGVILATIGKKKIPYRLYTPPEVKTGICGWGKAGKEQVQTMVTKLLNLTEVPKPDDSADALAIAICHSTAYKF